MKALEVFRRNQKNKVSPVSPVEKSLVVTAKATNHGAVTAVTSVTTKINNSEKKNNVFCYRIKDNPTSILIAIMPGSNLKDARRILKNQFGDRLLMVSEK